MTGRQLADLLNVIVSKRGSDNFCQLSGVRFKMQDGKATEIQVLVDPADVSKGFAPLDPAKSYKVGATNFMTGVSGIYKPLFAQAANVVDTQQDIGTLLTDTIQKQGTITASLDGRMGTVPTAPAAQATATPAPAEATAISVPAAQATATSIPGGAGAGTGESTAPGMPTTGGASDSAAAWLLAALVLSLAILAIGFGMRERLAGDKHSAGGYKH